MNAQTIATLKPIASVFGDHQREHPIVAEHYQIVVAIGVPRVATRVAVHLCHQDEAVLSHGPSRPADLGLIDPNVAPAMVAVDCHYGCDDGVVAVAAPRPQDHPFVRTVDTS